MSNVHIVNEGYCKEKDKESFVANCSCTLLTGCHNIIIDTMTAWDSIKILRALQERNMTPDDIDFVISTHSHSDHIGNNNMFLKAKHIIGYNISFQDRYFFHSFDKGEPYIINDSVKVMPTPGHTLNDVSVIVTNSKSETIAIVGDLFECREDIKEPNMWLEAGSEDPLEQMRNRLKIINIADWIVPGHGPKFAVDNEMRKILKEQLERMDTDKQLPGWKLVKKDVLIKL